MLTSHLAQLRPLCPTCRLAGRGAQALTLGHVAQAQGEEVIEGVLLCPHPACQREHPVLDGIPVVVSDIAGWAAHQLEGTLRRDDLSPFAESLLGDAAGPGSGFHAERTNLGIYGWGHWGDWVAAAGRAHGGAYARLLEDALALAEATPGGLGRGSEAPATATARCC
ncbi:hypothetical protein ABXN37_24360 [Piscinibacter sakaiensis]|uniref:hypothetical protein n=1 Tax=Piscinibacter sakaiensis TaxID=1547922 RepID=UPI00372A91D2